MCPESGRNSSSGQSGGAKDTVTEAREDRGSQQLQAIECDWSICCVWRALTDGAEKISSIQSGCVHSVHLLSCAWHRAYQVAEAP